MKWMPALLLTMAPVASAWAQDNNRADLDSKRPYLEHRNDLGVIAYCTEKGLLPADSDRYFKIGLEEMYGKPSPTPKGDLHEQKGRAGIAYLEGEEQTLAELAADNKVQVSDVCADHKTQVGLAKIVATKKGLK